MQEDSSSRAHLVVPCCDTGNFCVPSSTQRVGSLSSPRSPLCQKPPLKLPASCVSHVALETGCGVTKQMGCSVQRSLMKNAAIPSCNSDCGSQLFSLCSGYQQSWEICYLRLRRKLVQYKNTFHLFCFSCFSSNAHL